ncbi:MAG: 4-hydroxybutyrate--acetyl-CoA CoA transferase [Clostridia bacterium]|nr:4-hydroxybutyrate--acetyl-CoA CoA transferase [Clostridia bacterium]
MSYKDKIITVHEAVNLVKSGDYIVTGVAASEAKMFQRHLPEIADCVKDVHISTCLVMEEYDYIVNPKYREAFFHDAWFYTPVFRKAHKNGNVSYVPNHLHLAVQGRLSYKKPNFYVGLASMPDEHGFMSIMSNAYEKEMMEQADYVILEINPKCPRTFGDNQVHVNEVTHLIEVDYDIPELPDVSFSEIDEVIADLVLGEIEDGSTIQLGIGGTPAAIASKLYNRKNLGIHTEMFTTSMAQLVKAGAINGMNKNIDKGLHVCTFILGTKELYDFVDNNPSVRVNTGVKTINPLVIKDCTKQISINAGLSVDLTGQVCSESIGSTHFTGTGGQSSTARGALLSEGGKSFIALYSTAMVRDQETGEKKRVSRIVSQLAAGSAVSLQRNDSDRIVTEYGIAYMQGRSLQERCEQLINIAHPDFREELRKEAIALGIIPGRN